ncbi:Anthranilate phosphoribosyltransferase like [hydrothermal vent metagenome]|uniref:Anthranilate phosphoribosyltransferase like n=1 Tax=hydrothermal vent metagenome TaxID=652676 RepID=A0A3B0Y5C2_9ZZZZ
MMTEEHPFAQYVRILGKGKNGSRSLTREEARIAMTMIVEDKVRPEQLGAFLMLLRVQEESPEEIAGFVDACKQIIKVPDTMPAIDLDWSSYAGKKRQLPWYILSTLLLAENNISVFMHGAAGHTPGRVYTKDILEHFGMAPCTSMQEVATAMQTHRFAYMDLEFLSPQLHHIIELRPILGLRSPVHTLSRMLNPFNCEYVMQGIFHPGYRPIHQEAAVLLDIPHLFVVKGDGGEIERNPDSPSVVQNVHQGEMFDEEWPKMFKRRHVRDDVMDVSRLVKLWHGSDQDEYGIAAVTGTAAMALKLMGRVDSIEQAEQMATDMWQKRLKDKFGAAA